ncbi:MAG: Hsp20/alpha crystallin family protein [Treponema sp.]|nr:Hsp20/alpha crystallin family protein [Treponema sp.]
MKSVSLYRPISMMDQLLGSFFESSLVPFTGNSMWNKLPLVNVQETEDAYLVEAELPGFDEKQIKVHVEGGKLSIETGKAEEKKEEKDTVCETAPASRAGASYLIRERRDVSFSRSFTLPENADTEAVSAVFKNGVLSLEIKKRKENSRRFIEIQSQ